MTLMQFTQRASAGLKRSIAFSPLSLPPKGLLLTPSNARFLKNESRRGNRSAEGCTQEAATDVSPGIAGALVAFERLLARHHDGRFRIVVSDLWVRYSLIPVDAADTLDDAELLALARGQLSRQHPETAEWPFRAALHGNMLLAAGIPPELIDGLQAHADKRGVRLTGIEPLFAYLWDRARGLQNLPDGWLLLEQPGLITVAYVRAGCISAQHSARQNRSGAMSAAIPIDATTLLERQSALLGIPAGDVSLFSCADRPLTLRHPWRIHQTAVY